MTSKEWTRSDFTFGRLLGSGQFGHVYEATHNLLD